MDCSRLLLRLSRRIHLWNGQESPFQSIHLRNYFGLWRGVACDSFHHRPEQLDSRITARASVLSGTGNCATSALHCLNFHCVQDTNQVFDPPSTFAAPIFHGRLVLASVLAVTLMQSN